MIFPVRLAYIALKFFDLNFEPGLAPGYRLVRPYSI
jgi:hypothetical protein